MSDTTSIEQKEALKQIEELRQNKIDIYDDLMACLLALRFDCVKQIGEIKRKAKLAVYYPNREAQQFARYEFWAKIFGVPPEQITNPFRTVIFWSKIFQKNGFRSLEDLRRRRPPGKIPR